jgi:hypothetical protein
VENVQNDAPQTKKNFWEGLPAILTAAAAFLTALGGVIALFVRSNNPAAVAPIEPVKAVAAAEDAATEEPAPKRQRIPQPTVARPVNVSGTWRDAFIGSTVRVIQDGKMLRTATFNPATGQQVAAGEAVIEGRSIVGTNRLLNGQIYAVRMTVSADGDSIDGTYSNPLTGEAGVGRLVR